MMPAPMPRKTAAARTVANRRSSLRIAARLSTRTVAVGLSSAPTVRFVQGEGRVASAFDVDVRIATAAAAMPVTHRVLAAIAFPPAGGAGRAGMVECGNERARGADCQELARNCCRRSL